MPDPLDALMHPVDSDEPGREEVIVVAPPNATLGGSTASIGLAPGAFGAVPFTATVRRDDEEHVKMAEADDEPAPNDNTIRRL